jgi:hypothetical protein
MKVLVVGSNRHLADEAKKETFDEVCRKIGAALADEGHEIVLGSEQSYTADRNVLDGAVATRKKLRLHFVRPFLDVTPELDHLPKDQVTITRVPLRGTWTSGRVSQILACDAVLLVGGSHGTSTTGYLAPELEKPVLALPWFGGAGEEVYKELGYHYYQVPALKARLGTIAKLSSATDVKLVVEFLEELIRCRAFKKSARMPLTLYTSLMLACLAAWVFVFDGQWWLQGNYAFFLMLALAGLLGTMLRNNLRMMFDPTAVFSWDELFIEIGTGLMLGFALALLYFVGALAFTGSTDAIPKGGERGDGDFQRIAVIMTLLGLGAGLMIERAAERVRGWFTSQWEQTSDRPRA